jgi:hypothetical protein
METRHVSLAAVFGNTSPQAFSNSLKISLEVKAIYAKPFATLSLRMLASWPKPIQRRTAFDAGNPKRIQPLPPALNNA